MKSPFYQTPVILAVVSLWCGVIPASAANVNIPDGATWTDTSGANNVTLEGSATLGADNIVDTLNISPTANGNALSNGGFTSVTILGGVLNVLPNNVFYDAAGVDFYFGSGGSAVAQINQTTGLFNSIGKIYATGLTLNSGGYFNVTADQSSSLQGTITLNGGITKMIGYSNAKFAATSDVVVNNGAEFVQYSGQNTVVASVTLNDGKLAEQYGTNSLTANSFNLKKGSVSVNLAGTGSTLTKSTSDTVVISAATTYTGATAVTGGTLEIAAGGSLANTSSISVSAGATLENANGFSITGPLILSEGSALLTSAADSAFAPASLTLNGNAADGWTAISLTSTAGDGLIKGGALIMTISGLAEATYNLTSGTAFSSAFNSASINGYALTTGDGGATFTGVGGGYSYLFNNFDNSLTVAAIPESGTSALLVIGFGLAFIAQRVRRRSNA